MKDCGSKGGKWEAIIEAGVKVFSEKGYHNARMEEIALAAGIGKGTIYEYFDSKLQLLQQVMNNGMEKYYNTLGTPELNNISFRERLYLIMEGHIRFCINNKQLTRIVFWDTEIFDEELKDWSYSHRIEKEDRMSDLITEAMERGELRRLDARLATYMIVGILGSIWAPITLEDWNEDAEELAEKMTDFIMNGIAEKN